MSTVNQVSRSAPAALLLKVFSAALALVVLAALFGPYGVNSNDAPEISFDGLHLQEDAKVAIAYMKPEADFSVYDKFLMLDAYVAFKKNWARNTKVAGRRISNKDIERIKKEAAALLHETFRQELDEKGGYNFVDAPDDSVLILRPALIDLEITAPDVMTAGRSTTYVASAGAATLFLELYDSVSGEILARIIDRRNMRDYGYAQWSNSVTNRNEARKMFRKWGSLLRTSFDEVRANAGKPSLTPEK